MSSNGPSPANTPPASTDAINVGFSSIGNRHGESSSRNGSKSSEKGSSGSGRKEETMSTQDEDAQQEEFRRSTGSTGQRARSSGGFLLDSVFANGSPRGPGRHGKRKTQDGQLRVGKRRVGPDRLSAASSLRSSPLSREVSMGRVDGPAEERENNINSRLPSMDAAQLVQMALNLSESRKRHASNSLRVPSATERRVSSMPMSNVGTVRAVSGTRQRGSQLSEDASRDSPSSMETPDVTEGNRRRSIPGLEDLPDNIFYTFTPATLARAEKARKYFELASEHRRLLDSLPPLKPDAPSSQTRSYNPIQSLRNRRIRIREKRPFPAPPDLWVDPEKVNNWIDDVESVTENCDYGAGDDTIVLPPFDGEHDGARPESRQLPNGPRHKRTDTVGSVITRPENSWTIEPTELLADAYWTERGDNKAYIETRRGEPIFPSWQRQRAGTPKISIDLSRDRNDSFEQGENGRDSLEYGRPSRRRQLLLPLTTGIERRKPSRLIKRTSFDSDDSSKERHVFGFRSASDEYENIGPLERHMEELIAKDEKGELSSPEMTSPDHWNSMLKQPPAQRHSIEMLRRDSASRPGGRASLEVPSDLHRRTRSADGRVGSVDHGRFSGDGDDTGSDPGSPIIDRNMPSIGMDLSPPTESRRSIDESRLKLPHLPTFHARNRERNKIGQADFADTSNALSPILSADSSHPSDSFSTSEYLKRQGTNESAMYLRRKDTGSTATSAKESSSSVGRFLKNRREQIFKGQKKGDGGTLSAGVSDVSEGEEPLNLNRPLKRRPTDEDSDASPRLSSERGRAKPKFHISNLPSFTSSARDKRIQIETPRSLNEDPRRPRRFDRPGLSLLTSAQASTSQLSTHTNGSSQTTRKTYGQLQPIFGEIGWQGRLNPGSFTPGISQAKRHWSIYDKLPSVEDDRVTARDITRARALLLSSGIKAREIQRRADDPEPKPSALITRAATTTHQTLEPVPLKDECLLAARMLSSHLTTSLNEFETLLSQFQNVTVRNLGTHLEDLRQRAADHLSTLVHDTSDEADAFTIELNTKYPQQIQRVNDAVDEMLRRQRRQFRLVRLTGFKILEWLVLGILWGIWLLVVVFNLVRKAVLLLWRILRWLFTPY